MQWKNNALINVQCVIVKVQNSKKNSGLLRKLRIKYQSKVLHDDEFYHK